MNKEKYFKAIYGENYSKAMEIYSTQVQKLKDNFAEKYSKADLNKFEFNVIVDANTLKFDTSIDYDVTKHYGTDITSKTFKDNYYWSLFRTPRIWNSRGTITGLKLESKSSVDFDNFDIYVNENDSFKCNLESLNVKWGIPKSDVTNSKFSYLEDPYSTTVVSTYVLSYKSGIS